MAIVTPFDHVVIRTVGCRPADDHLGQSRELDQQVEYCSKNSLRDRPAAVTKSLKRSFGVKRRPRRSLRTGRDDRVTALIMRSASRLRGTSSAIRIPARTMIDGSTPPSLSQISSVMNGY
jgi:hypothetical protein